MFLTLTLYWIFLFLSIVYREKSFFNLHIVKSISVTESVTDYVTESVTDFVTESVTDSVTESVTDSVTEFVTDSVTEFVTDFFGHSFGH